MDKGLLQAADATKTAKQEHKNVAWRKTFNLVYGAIEVGDSIQNINTSDSK